jgi:hypothetical protein
VRKVSFCCGLVASRGAGSEFLLWSLLLVEPVLLLIRWIRLSVASRGADLALNSMDKAGSHWFEELY